MDWQEWFKHLRFCQCKGVKRQVIRLKNFCIGSLNKILLAFIVITLVIKNQNSKGFIANIVFLVSIQLRDKRLSELCFTCSHRSNNTGIRMEYLICIIG